MPNSLPQEPSGHKEKVRPTEDIIIVGAGPAGLTAGLYAARAGHSVLLLEQMAPGGQAATTYRIDNYPGTPEINGAELITRMEGQAKAFGVRITSEEVTGIQAGAPHKIFTPSGPYFARSIILATGAAFRNLGVPGETELRGHGVSYCATCDGAFFRNLPVAVVGGGNTALEEAEFLTRFASKIYLLHRREQFRADKFLQTQVLNHPKIEVMTPFYPRKIIGTSEVESLQVERCDTGELRELKVNGVFIFVGSRPQTEFLGQTVARDAEGYIQTKPDLATNIPGIFAAGDCRANMVKQVVVATGEGATAAIMADRYLQNLPAA